MPTVLSDVAPPLERQNFFQVWFTHKEGLSEAETESVTAVPQAMVGAMRRDIDEPEAE